MVEAEVQGKGGFHGKSILDKASLNPSGKLGNESSPLAQPPEQPQPDSQNTTSMKSSHDPCGNSQASACPECASSELYKDGLRYLADGSFTQRLLCKSCGYRFTAPKALREKPYWYINNARHHTSDRQICALDGRVENLAKVETRQESNVLVGDGKTDPTAIDQTVKGKLVEYEFWMQKQGYKEPTIKTRVVRLQTLAKRGANLLDPESVKQTLAFQTTWSDGTKSNAADAYSCFLEKEGLTWKPPRYRRTETIPFVPSEAELNQLIGSCGKTLGAFLQGLKETGADPGELAAITCKDVNKEARTVTINRPVKRHRPRILTVSAELIRRLESVTCGQERIFDDFILRRAFYYKRKTTAHKLKPSAAADNVHNVSPLVWNDGVPQNQRHSARSKASRTQKHPEHADLHRLGKQTLQQSKRRLYLKSGKQHRRSMRPSRSRIRVRHRRIRRRRKNLQEAKLKATAI